MKCFYQTIRSNWNKFVERQFVAITTATTKCSRWMCFLICNKHQESKLNENRTYKTRRRKTHERAYVPQASRRSCLKRCNIKETELVNQAKIPNHSCIRRKKHRKHRKQNIWINYSHFKKTKKIKCPIQRKTLTPKTGLGGRGHKMIEDKKTPDEDMSLKRLHEITTYTSNITYGTIEEWNESKIGYDLRYQFQL